MNYDSLKLENQLCFPLYAVSKEIIKKYKPILDPLGLTYTQYITLMALWEDDNLTVKALGEKLFLDSGTLTPLLKKLESQGLIIRERSLEDERNVYIRLTERGIGLKDQALSAPIVMKKCMDLSDKDFNELYRILHQMLEKK